MLPGHIALRLSRVSAETEKFSHKNLLYYYFYMEKIKIDRINELGRLMKERELTEAEKAEQAALRAEYMAEVRAALRKK